MTPSGPPRAPAPEPIDGVRWIGGGSGAGKSSIARRLAAEHALRLYATDDVMADHAARLTPAEAPLLTRFAAMSMDERWVDRSPEEMLATFHWYAGEGFTHIVDDVRRLAAEDERPVLVEGFRLLPHLVAPLLAEPAHAVWLLPTPAFRAAALVSRGWTGIAAPTSDPARAQANLHARDALFTTRLAAETAHLRLPTIPVDGTHTEAALTTEVAHSLGL